MQTRYVIDMLTRSPVITKTLGLASLLTASIGFPAVGFCEEASQHLLTSLSTTTISGFVDTSAQWNLGSGQTLSVPEPASILLLAVGVGALLAISRRAKPDAR